MPRPRAGEWLDDEIIGWQMEGIDTVVSLLELAEISELGREREAELSREHGIEVYFLPHSGQGIACVIGNGACTNHGAPGPRREGRRDSLPSWDRAVISYCSRRPHLLRL